MLNEVGGHRIQRTPPTERRGRVHTSTVTVACVDDAAPKAVHLSDKDVRVEWFSGSGGGGQHRNKHMNSCRLVHIPTGMMVCAQTRSRENSYTQAMKELKDRLTSNQRCSIEQELSHLRTSQMGSGERGDKMRTYRFQDDVVKDHRSGKQASVRKVLSGKFDLLWS